MLNIPYGKSNSLQHLVMSHAAIHPRCVHVCLIFKYFSSNYDSTPAGADIPDHDIVNPRSR
jgi:hypothetical protein